ncbi:MAG: UPF0175 family protein [Ardenticatenaceae bacterium]
MAFETVTAENVLEQFLILSPADQEWLREQLDRLDDLPENGSLNGDEPKTSAIWQEDDQEPLPESASLDEAIELYLADRCSVGRAAELAGVTRWDLQHILYERGTPVEIYGHRTAEEIDELAEELEREGILDCGLRNEEFAQRAPVAARQYSLSRRIDYGATVFAIAPNSGQSPNRLRHDSIRYRAE